MATSFPGALDSFTNPTGGQVQGSTTPTHSGHHANANDAIEAIEAKLGIGSSTPVANTILGGSGTGSTSFRTIVNADIDSAAAIAYSKLSLANSIATADIVASAVTTRIAAASGSTTPGTTNTAITAMADPTLSINLPVTGDVLVWFTSTFNDSAGNAIVSYFVRIGGGSWVQICETSQPTSAGRWSVAGVHIFQSVTSGAKTIEIGNASNTSSNTITHYPTPRRLVALGIVR